jgi:hypothetical protein
MDNRERDKKSWNTESTSAGDVNRNTSSQSGKDKSDSSADFGQDIGQSEKLNEPNSRNVNSGSTGYDSSSNRQSGKPMNDELRNSGNSSGNKPSSGERH